MLIHNGLLIALLMLGQATLFAHEALHDINSSNDTVCTACLNSPLFDGANPSATFISDITHAGEAVIEHDTPDTTPVYLHETAQPRAPPSSS